MLGSAGHSGGGVDSRTQNDWRSFPLLLLPTWRISKLYLPFTKISFAAARVRRLARADRLREFIAGHLGRFSFIAFSRALVSFRKPCQPALPIVLDLLVFCGIQL
jgi:hypothetical protein